MSTKNTRSTALSSAALSGLLRQQGVNPKNCGSLLGYDPAQWRRRLKNGVSDEAEAAKLREAIKGLSADTDAGEEPEIETAAAAAKAEEATPKAAAKSKKSKGKAEKVERPKPPANVNRITWSRHFGMDSTQIQRTMAVAGYSADQGIELLRSLGEDTNSKLIRLRFATPDEPAGWEVASVLKYGPFGGPPRSQAIVWKDTPLEFRKAVEAAVGKPAGEPLTPPSEGEGDEKVA